MDGDQTEVFGDSLVAFLHPSEQGALTGSGVIIPRRHAETVFDLTPEEIFATFALLFKVKAWMETEYEPDCYNVGRNCLEVGGQIVTDTKPVHHVLSTFRGTETAELGESQPRSCVSSPRKCWNVPTFFQRLNPSRTTFCC